MIFLRRNSKIQSHLNWKQRWDLIGTSHVLTPMTFCVLCCSCCLIPICPFPLLSVLLLPLPPSLAFSRGRSGEMRTSWQQTGKWQRSGNAGWGPHGRFPSPQGSQHSGTDPSPSCCPTPLWPRGDGPHTTDTIAEADLVQCTGYIPRHHPSPSLQELALSHSRGVPALVQHEGPLGGLWDLNFWANKRNWWADATFSSCALPARQPASPIYLTLMVNSEIYEQPQGSIPPELP